MIIKYLKMKSSNARGKMNSKPRLAWLAILLIIVGSVSFSNHPAIGYVVLGLGFAIGAYTEFFSGKKNEK